MSAKSWRPLLPPPSTFTYFTHQQAGLLARTSSCSRQPSGPGSSALSVELQSQNAQILSPLVPQNDTSSSKGFFLFYSNLIFENPLTSVNFCTWHIESTQSILAWFACFWPACGSVLMSSPLTSITFLGSSLRQKELLPPPNILFPSTSMLIYDTNIAAFTLQVIEKWNENIYTLWYLSKALFWYFGPESQSPGEDGQVQCQKLELWNLNSRSVSYQVAVWSSTGYLTSLFSRFSLYPAFLPRKLTGMDYINRLHLPEMTFGQGLITGRRV